MVKRYNGGVIIANQISTTNLSASGFFGLTQAANASAKGQWPGNIPQINISPAVSGLTVWDFSTNGTLNLSSPGTWTIIPYVNINVNAKVWGGGGSDTGGGGGGGGGFSQGLVRLQAGVGYSLVVGDGGARSNTCRAGGGGGGGSGLQINTGIIPIIIAGGGGGSGAPGSAGVSGGPGGGTTGVAAGGGNGPGQPGTQSAAGAGGVGTRRTGGAGVGQNGGTGSAGTGVVNAGGAGLGNGGGGGRCIGDAGGGGGGGGYYGGGGGGGDAGGGAGAGGSGYYSPTYVTSGTLTAGSGTVPGNSACSFRISSGNGGTNAAGQPGRVVLYL